MAAAAAGRFYVCGGMAAFAMQVEQQHVEARQARAPAQKNEHEDKALEATRQELHSTITVYMVRY